MWTARYETGTDLNIAKHEYTQIEGSLLEVLDHIDECPEPQRSALKAVQR